MDVIGCLEYEPDIPANLRPKHRQFLQDQVGRGWAGPGGQGVHDLVSRGGLGCDQTRPRPRRRPTPPTHTPRHPIGVRAPHPTPQSHTGGSVQGGGPHHQLHAPTRPFLPPCRFFFTPVFFLTASPPHLLPSCRRCSRRWCPSAAARSGPRSTRPTACRWVGGWAVAVVPPAAGGVVPGPPLVPLLRCRSGAACSASRPCWAGLLASLSTVPYVSLSAAPACQPSAVPAR